MDHEQRSALSRRVTSLESLLVERGVVTTAELDGIVDRFVEKVGAGNGGNVVARAWVDDDFRNRLLADAGTAVGELGLGQAFGFQAHRHFVVLGNTPQLHNLVVCTLCSCYPSALLGPPPNWYKSDAYRARAVRDPRGVLQEFGVHLHDDVEIRVWDSTAETRYMVLPLRPAGTEDLSEQELAGLVTREALVGTAVVPAQGNPPPQRRMGSSLESRPSASP